MHIDRRAVWFLSKVCFQKLALLIVFWPILHSLVFAGDGFEWARLRVVPSVTVSETYSSNIYLEEENETEDYITAITPEVTLDIAVVPKNYFSLKYRGDYYSYADASNFKDYHHSGSVSFNSETNKGSHLIFGVSGEDTAIQPFSEQEQSKDYTLLTIYGDILLLLGTVTELGTEYRYSERDFDALQYADDDYTRNRWDLYLLYKRSQVFPLLLQYRYVDQDNNDLGALTTDFQSHTVFVGGRWRSARRLSGALRVGYVWAEFDESDGEDYYGYAVDTNLVYAFSESTRIALDMDSAIQQPTQSARESGDYYIDTTIGIRVTHRRWERITTRLNLLYRNRDYTEIEGSESVRVDDFYRVGLTIAWTPRDWMSFSLGYQYQQNLSNFSFEEYTEDLIRFGITLSM